ncbi:hypothetical protein [Acinetobacter radioresistens]|uniref:hypothetical protein n=1 Tax=Acinetobacter radioresistens TaxID=40216 RepID=UPI0039F64FD9
MRANWLCGRFCVQASSFENYIAEKPFTDRFVQQSHPVLKKYLGKEFIEVWCTVKSAEYYNVYNQITETEQNWDI